MTIGQRYAVYAACVLLSLTVYWLLPWWTSILLVVGTWGFLLAEGRRSW